MLLDASYRIFEAVYHRDGHPAVSVTVDAFPSGTDDRPEWHVWFDHHEGEAWVGDTLEICHSRAAALRLAKRWCRDAETDPTLTCDYCDEQLTPRKGNQQYMQC